MNKKIILNLMVLAALAWVVACSGKKEETAGDDHAHHHSADTTVKNDEWVAMDEFHMIMAESFHPFKDSANLEPAKAKAEEMAAAAEKWANAPLPEKVNTDEVKTKLAELKAETSAFVQTVKTNDAKTIGDNLTKLHDLFHEIQETWYGGHGHHH
jgi:hypothetical protein